MGKETKIGLAVIGVLVSAFGVLLMKYVHVGQSFGRWEDEPPIAAPPFASPNSNDKPNVVVAQTSDPAGGGTGDALWNSPGQASSEPAGEVPSASYMPAEAEPTAVADPYAIRSDDVAADELSAAADQPLNVNPFQNRPLDDIEAAADVPMPAGTANDAPARLPNNQPPSDPRPNPLRQLSAELPVNSDDEPAGAEQDSQLADPYQRDAIDSLPTGPTDAFNAGQSPGGLKPAPDEDPFGQPVPAVPQDDQRRAVSADDAFDRADADFQQQPPQDDLRLQGVGENVPREPIADDWQTDGMLDEPASIGNDPLPVENGMYTVQPNDTLWLISEKVYGTGGYFKALAAHNRASLPRSDQLTVGMQIAVPQVNELQQKYPSLSPKQRRSALVQPRAERAAATKPAAGSGAYLVEEGDTLFDIARYELGKASRWAEIYELNRDKLGEDFDYLQPGIELSLPPRTRATESISRGGDSRYLR